MVLSKIPKEKYRVLTAPLRMSPDFIIIGVQKGGTTSLFSYLSQHPQLKLARRKELHYYDLNYDRGLSWYRSFFPIKPVYRNVLTGEASPYYIFHPLVPERIYKDNPNIKLLLLLRDPIHRAYSHYQMEKRKGKEKVATFEEAIEKEAERIKNSTLTIQNNQYDYNHQVYSYLARGIYHEQIARYLNYFKREQLLVLKSEDFFSRPLEALEKVYLFLGIKSIFPEHISVKNGGNYLPIGGEILNNLRVFYKPYNERLSALLGQEFNWD